MFALIPYDVVRDFRVYPPPHFSTMAQGFIVAASTIAPCIELCKFDHFLLATTSSTKTRLPVRFCSSCAPFDCFNEGCATPESPTRLPFPHSCFLREFVFQ